MGWLGIASPSLPFKLAMWDLHRQRKKRIKHSSDQDFQEGLNAGDAIQAAINGDDLILRKPHGGEFKTKIVKRVRAQ